MTTEDNEKRWPRLLHWLNVLVLVGGEAFIVGLAGAVMKLGDFSVIAIMVWGGLGLLVSAGFLYVVIFFEFEGSDDR